MVHNKRILTISIAIIMVFTFVLSACGDDEVTLTETGNENVSTKDEVVLTETDNENVSTTDENETIEESPAAEEPQITSAFSYPLTGATEFENERAWIKYTDGGATYLSGVTPEGEIVFSLQEENPVYYCAPFEDGVSFYVAGGDEGQYETIVDEHGDVHYRAGLNPASGALEEHILCHGDGKFVITRHISGMTQDEWQLGCIDADGNELTEFIVLEESFVSGSAYGIFRKPEQMNTEYDTYKVTSGDWTEVSRSLGNGLYFLPAAGLAQDIIYNSESNIYFWKYYRSDGGTGDIISPVVADGKIVDSGYGKIWVSDLEGQSAKSFGTKAAYWTGKISLKDGLLFVTNYEEEILGNYSNSDLRRGYVNLSGDMIISLSDLYPDLSLWGYPFYDGHAIVWIKGQDGKNYVTVIDTDGNELFEPFVMDSVVDSRIVDGYFVIKSPEGKRQIVDLDGNIVHDLSADLPEKFYYCIGDPYCVLNNKTSGKYFYFRLTDVAASGEDVYDIENASF